MQNEDSFRAIEFGPLRMNDVAYIVHRQGVVYAKEHGWDPDYEAMVAAILDDFVGNFDPTREAAWIARRDGRIKGSIFLARGEGDAAKLRLLFVEPDMRGTGLGAVLVDKCIDRARSLGYRRLDLWTGNVLITARRLYERRGFVLVEGIRQRLFGQDLVTETWSLDLCQCRHREGAGSAERDPRLN